MTHTPLALVLLAFVSGCSCAASHELDAAPGRDTGGAEDALGAEDAAPSGDDAASPADAVVPMDAPRADTGACTDDAREEDDTLAAGLAQDPIYDLDGHTELTALTACPGDDDWFHGYADCCDNALGADLTWSAAEGSLELEIVAPDGSAWPVDDIVTEAGHARRVETSTAEGRDFLVHVHNPGSAPVRYDVTVLARVFGP
ncbi:MAG: hypothetical protein U0234_28210 [Sandaracinus sp.]